MHSILSKRSLFALCLVTIAGVAAMPTRAIADDGGIDDAGLDAATSDAETDAVAPDAATGMTGMMDATTMGTMDATTTPPPATASGGYPMDDGMLPVYTGGDIFQRLCIQNPTVDDPSAVPFAFNSIKAAYPDATSCKAFDAQGHMAVHDCLCDKCFDVIQECDSRPGCREILKCELDAGCGDPSACYFGACQKVIDKWANTSNDSFITYLIEQCQTANSCPKQ